MPDQPLQPPSFDRAALGQLACPACYGDLQSEDACLVCTTCRCAYPIIDGIPVLIVERSEMPADQSE
jgi:uncharacterized protein YbaR (Trm112 family)